MCHASDALTLVKAESVQKAELEAARQVRAEAAGALNIQEQRGMLRLMQGRVVTPHLR